MDFQVMQTQLRQKYKAVKFQFAMVELDLAITYCQIAVATTDQARSRRNVAKAEHAYRTAVRFLDDHLLSSQNLDVKDRLNLFLALRATCNGNHRIQ